MASGGRKSIISLAPLGVQAYVSKTEFQSDLSSFLHLGLVSGLAGIYNLDGRPAESAPIAHMLQVIAHRGPDGISHYINGPISLGSALLGATPESAQELRPRYDQAAGFSIAMDGRVDNRDDLKAALGPSPSIDSDAELVLRAYQRWGEDSPRHIIGDFAYVIWDSRCRTLFCARDHLGLRPFFYYTDGRVFLWASEPRQLLDHPSVPRRPNEGMIAEFLAYDVTSSEETLYQGILRLPPAHFLSVSSTGIRKQRYWDIDRSHQIRYKTDQEYADHLRDTFRDAVRCRLRGTHPVAAELSGGVDSSCVVGMCQHLFHGGAVPDSGFETFSEVFPGLPADETTWLRQVARFWNLKSNELVAPPDPAWYPECASRYLYLPDPPNGHTSDFCSALARARGFQVILTGLGGDDWFGGSPAASSRFCRALHRLRAQPNIQGCRSLSHDFLQLIRRRVRRSPKSVAPWIPPAFARRTCLVERTRRRSTLTDPSNAFRLHWLEMKDRAAARCGIEARHPFYDRRIIELAYAMPPDQFVRRGQNKFILRQAMKGLVPDSVLQRSTKAEFSHTSAQLYEFDSISSVFHSARIASQGWIDQDCVAAMFQEFMGKWNHGQKDDLPHFWPLTMVLGIELWFRAAFCDTGGIAARH